MQTCFSQVVTCVPFRQNFELHSPVCAETPSKTYSYVEKTLIFRPHGANGQDVDSDDRNRRADRHRRVDMMKDLSTGISAMSGIYSDLSVFFLLEGF